jgi:hypothetical protein
MAFDYEAGVQDALLGRPCIMCTPCPYQEGFVAAGGKLPFDTTKGGRQTVHVVSEARDPTKPKWLHIIGMFASEGDAKTFASKRALKTKVQSIVLFIVKGVATVPDKYTAERVKAEVDKDREHLFAEYAAGRMPTWGCDQATKDLVCTGKWLKEELVRLGVSDEDRRAQEHFYNRWTRGEAAYFEIAAQALNAVLEGKVEHGRYTPGQHEHRGW